MLLPLDAEPQQEVVVRIVARSRVRLLDGAVLGELLGDASAEPLEVLAERVPWHEPADEQA